MKKNKNADNSDQNKVRYNLEGDTLYLYNSLDFAQAGNFTTAILKELKNYNAQGLIINLEGIKQIDSAGVTAVFFLKRKLIEKGIAVKIEKASDSVNKKLALFGPAKTTPVDKPYKPSFLELTGSKLQYFFTYYIIEFFSLAANIFYWSINDLFGTKVRRKGEVINQAVLIGVNATLIVMVMTFVIGLVMALHSSTQLRNFGANIFVVDLTVIAMMAQMGPLITAIIVAGRSGSAIAAEISTMKVTSELDALTTMGLNPIRFVVVPKLYGVLITMPFLVILANTAGIVGGMVAAHLFLDITPEVFINRMGQSLYNKDILTGIIKSLVYGTIIVLTGSFYGFKVKDSTEDVGIVTTTAVVVSISLVIIADSIMGLIFY